MAQADGVVANGTGSAVRSDINTQYAALWSNHSGSTEPSSGKVAYQFWADTNTSILKIRNSANNAWINLFTLAGGLDVDAASNFNNDVTFQCDSGTLFFDKSDNALEFSNNVKAKFGDSSDLEISHSGTHTFFENTTGNVYFRNDGSATYFQMGSGNESSIVLAKDDYVGLHFDGAQKLATTSTGVTVTGTGYVSGGWRPSADGGASLGSGSYRWYDLNISNDINIADNGKVILGDGSDLTIFHDGTGCNIKSTSAKLEIRSADLLLQDSAAEKYFRGVSNGQVEFYYDNTKQFSTHANGPYTESNVGLRCGSSGPVGAELFTVQRNAGQVAYFDHSGGDDHIVIQCRHRGAYSTTYRTQMSFIDGAGDEVGTIKSHGTSTQYNTTSDYRLKENEILISDGITRLKTLKPYRFNFKKTPGNTVDGFFAHEVTAVPEAIAGEKDGTKSQGLDYSKLTPLLTAALQEAITKIETLETKVAALEAK